MKIKLIIIIAMSLLLGSNKLETPEYTLIKKFKDFELRNYSSMVIATTKMNMGYSQSTSRGFQKVASYIFGGNDRNMKIEMTAPVLTSIAEEDNLFHEVSFVMPKKHKFQSLPKPSRNDVDLREKEIGMVAVLSFGGWATEERSKKYIKKLKKYLRRENIVLGKEIIIAQYNSPWVVPPFRKNEIIISIVP